MGFNADDVFNWIVNVSQHFFLRKRTRVGANNSSGLTISWNFMEIEWRQHGGFINNVDGTSG